MKKVIITLSAFMFLPHIATCQDIPVYRNNAIAGYLYTETPTTNLDDYYLLDTLTVLEKKIIVHTGVSDFGTDTGMELFCRATYVEVEKIDNDTAIIKFDNEFGISVRKDEKGDIRIYNLFSFNYNRDKICITEMDRLLDDRIIITHSEHDTFEFPACNHEPVISLLKKYALLKETNPTHQDETNEVNTIFLRALHGLNGFTDTEKNHFRTKALLMLYDNSVAIFEDATDYDRMAIRKSLCYMTLSLLSDEYRYQSFTKDAINSVSDILPERKYQQIVLIRLLEILMMHQFDNITPKEIEEKWKNLQHFFETSTTYFDKEFMDDFDYLCNLLMQKTNLMINY